MNMKGGPSFEKINNGDSESAESGVSRRDFLRFGVGAAAGFALGRGVFRSPEESPREDREVEEPQPEDRYEAPMSAEAFTKELVLWAAQYQLAYDEIQFYDVEGNLVGEPIKFQDVIVDRTRENAKGETEIFKYRLTPGPVNSNGMVESGIAREWSEYMRTVVATQYPEVTLDDRFLHVTGDFSAAYEREENEDLRNEIDKGNIRHYYELVGFFADQPAYPGSNLSRQAYLQQEIQFDENIPSVVQAELRHLVVGLAGLESKFEPHLTNGRSGATGILQFLPNTWQDYNDDPEAIHDFVAQVDAAGKHLSMVYREVVRNMGSELFREVRAHFDNDEAFARDFLVPMTINGYKAGHNRVGRGIVQALQQIDLAEIPPGKDLFIELADHMRASTESSLAEYGPLSRAYVPQVYAQTLVLANRPQEQH